MVKFVLTWDQREHLQKLHTFPLNMPAIQYAKFL